MAVSSPSCFPQSLHAALASSISRLSLLVVLGATLLAGCAETKYRMHLDPEPVARNAALVWPAPPETARFRYAGQLTGEDNFVPDNAHDPGLAVGVLKWLVGIFDAAEDKVVLKRPQTGMVDEQGRVLVTDIGNQAVFVFDNVNAQLHVYRQATELRNFVTPIGIVQGPNGQILVADAELGEVFRLGANGKPLGSFGKNVLNRPTGLARDPERGLVYVSDTHAHDVKIFDDDGRLVDSIGNRGDDEGTLNFPTHLAYAKDRLYVTDGMNARVQIFDTQGRVITTVGRRGLYVGEMTRPKGVTVDTHGNIYVVESFYDNLLVYNSQGQFLMPIGGTGKEIGQFYLPAGVWSDRQNRIYVADMFNGRIVIFQLIGGA
ncbi:6-bladed beta-propeller [Noviherbaspirillum sp. ST9]|uniref:6-bladed beta-propeller n=1 Tax=Noviherbaspirillum sp. ST9 TaxID=3401606 RepID=UPI003B58956F